MKKYLLTLVCIACSLTTVVAQSSMTAADFFTSAPQSVFPLLDRNTRLDMVDYFNSGMTTPSQNKLDGRSVITEMTPESVTVKMTDASAIQLVALKGEKGTIIALINTVATPALDSSIKFFDSKWTPIKQSDCFAKPDWNEWLTESGRKNKDDVMMQVPFILASYRIDPSTFVLTLTNNLSRFLDKEIFDDITPYINLQLTYTWVGSKFKLSR